jgi:hypothetical protein
MLINFSNHPSANWPAEQRAAAEQQFGEIHDLPFPDVDPNGDEEYIQSLCDEYISKIKHLHSNNYTLYSKPTIHIMGEMNFTYSMVRLLQNYGFTCVSSTTERIVKEEDGVKISEFQFVKFRKYL